MVQDSAVPGNPEKDEQLFELSSPNKCRDVIKLSVLMILISSAGEMRMAVCLFRNLQRFQFVHPLLPQNVILSFTVHVGVFNVPIENGNISFKISLKILQTDFTLLNV